MSKLLIPFFLFLTIGVQGQPYKPTNITFKDSVKLINTWKQLKKALELKDTKTLRNLSLKTIHCDLFETIDPKLTYEQSIAVTYMSLNTFLIQYYKNLPKSKLFEVMKYKKYNISEAYLNFPPPNMKIHRSMPITLYDILYVTFEPNEIAKGHEGASEGFEFVKMKDEFKFFGLTSIP
ncbi:hypothetical protein [Mucilaginibacter sp.]|uniref:hypothetical protein n=1 Tax=Mucilaginibacter sp. TaxID=1882438 RepID=UPI003D14DD52